MPHKPTYYSFPAGMVMPGRSFTAGDECGYRFGFNGKENTDEINGEGNAVDFGARIYDSRLGRWMSRDPLEAKYPNLSAYNYCANNPIIYVDPDGRVLQFYGDRKELNVAQALSIINLQAVG